MSLDLARTIADAVLWEGYLLYPYGARSSKNQIRWQFGVLGPPVVALSGIAEDPVMRCECLVRPTPQARVRITLRFLHLVRRQIEQATGGAFRPVDSLLAGEETLVSFDEATACEMTFGPFDLTALFAGQELPVVVQSAVDTVIVTDAAGSTIGRTVRTRGALSGTFTVRAEPTGTAPTATLRLTCTVCNTHPDLVRDRDEATAVSFLGAHLLLEADAGSFVSLLEPSTADEAAAKGCHQSRCYPVLAGAPGDTNVVLASPIILYDYPAVAPESAGALFDSTEIDEILTLRVMTLTDAEKAAARATDPAAAAIIDRCEAMTPEALGRLHGALRDPRAWDGAADAEWATDPDELGNRWNAETFSDSEIPVFATPDAPWWDPGVDASVSPTTDSVIISGVRVAKGSIVRLQPSRRADAQDLFYAGQQARVTSVYSDVDDNTHVAVVLDDDPAADLHEWYGRYLYFAPEELQPLDTAVTDPAADRAHPNRSKENQS